MLIVAETPRLILRTWQETDLEAYSDLVGKPHPGSGYSAFVPANRAEAELWNYQVELDQQGWSRWAVVLKETYQLVGYCGFSRYGREVEMSWRFRQEYRGKGLVVEAVEAVTELGFKRLGFEKIISYASPNNEFALEVIEELGMNLDRFEGWSSITVARYSLASADF